MRYALEAMRWLGTPFHPHAMQHGVGCDCYGLIYGVWCRVNSRSYGALPTYPNHDATLEDVEAHLLSIALRIEGRPQPGDILGFTTKNGQTLHCGIFTEDHSFIYAVNSRSKREVIESRFSDVWRQRHGCTFRYHTINNSLETLDPRSSQG